MNSTFYNIPPNQRVSILLQCSKSTDQLVEKHPKVFCELQEIKRRSKESIGFWQESARWLTFEEDVEEDGVCWSRPHVATLSFHHIFLLRKILGSSVCMFGRHANSLNEILELLYDSCKSFISPSNQNKDDILAKLHQQLFAPHIHMNSDKSEKNSIDAMSSVLDVG